MCVRAFVCGRACVRVRTHTLINVENLCAPSFANIMARVWQLVNTRSHSFTSQTKRTFVIARVDNIIEPELSVRTSSNLGPHYVSEKNTTKKASRVFHSALESVRNTCVGLLGISMPPGTFSTLIWFKRTRELTVNSWPHTSSM